MSLPESSNLPIIWQWEDGSFDRVQLRQVPQGWDAVGRHGDTRYVITLDRDNAAQSVEVSSGDHTCALRRGPNGWWSATGHLIPDSSEVLDLDLGWSALTNSFPIRRLQAQGADEGTFDVLMITLPHLEVRKVRQSYTLQEYGWQYLNLESGFSACLTVDKDGLVTEYPGLCSRRT